jgi:hypothetical protein
MQVMYTYLAKLFRDVIDMLLLRLRQLSAFAPRYSPQAFTPTHNHAGSDGADFGGLLRGEI